LYYNVFKFKIAVCSFLAAVEAIALKFSCKNNVINSDTQQEAKLPLVAHTSIPNKPAICTLGVCCSPQKRKRRKGMKKFSTNKIFWKNFL
jgi:hypothetical protein